MIKIKTVKIMSINKDQQRRNFIKKSALATTGLLMGSQLKLTGAPAIIKHYNKPVSLINGVQLGVQTYSFRSMEDQSAEATLKYIKDCGMNATELMGGPAESFAGMPESSVSRWAYYRLVRKQRDESLTADEEKEMQEMKLALDAYQKEVADWRASVSMDAFEKFRKMYNDAGVQIYGFKPRAFGKDNTDAEINFGFKAAKALGASHVTLEHPSNDEHTLKLGKMAAKHKINVAYHGHEQQTPTFWDTALEQSKYNSMNPDMGHYIAAGNTNPIEFLKKYNERISSIHIKDRQTPENGKGNLLWGTGDTPIEEILQLMKSEKYKFPATVEFEYEIPEGSDAVKEVAKCLDYCEKALS